MKKSKATNENAQKNMATINMVSIFSF